MNNENEKISNNNIEMEQSERASSREITLNFLTKLCKVNQKCRIEMIDGYIIFVHYRYINN
jgi:hypothetical protein